MYVTLHISIHTNQMGRTLLLFQYYPSFTIPLVSFECVQKLDNKQIQNHCICQKEFYSKEISVEPYIWKEKIPSRIDFLRNDFGNCCARCRLAAFINSCYSSSKSNFHTLSDMMNLHFSKMRAMDCRIVFIWCLTLRKNEKIHRHFSVIAKKCYFLILFRYVTTSTKRYHLDTNLYMTWLNLYQEVIIDPFLVENILPCLHYLLAIRLVDCAQFFRKC